MTSRSSIWRRSQVIFRDNFEPDNAEPENAEPENAETEVQYAANISSYQNDHLEYSNNESENESMNLSRSDISDQSDDQADSNYNDTLDSESEPLDSEVDQTFTYQLSELLTIHPVTHRFTNELLALLKKNGHAELPADRRTLLQSPRKVNVINKCGGSFLYIGLQKGISSLNIDFENPVKILFNADGIPLFKSTGIDMWPILGMIKKSVFTIALFCGNHKPDPAEFLEDLLIEIKLLQENGIIINETKYDMLIEGFCNDAPARSMLKGIISHTGYYSCERCEIPGITQSHRRTFNDMHIYPSRDDYSFNDLAYLGTHQKFASTLIGSGIKCVNQFILDYMHLVCLGVVKRLLSFLMKGPKECRLSKKQIDEISNRLNNLRGLLPSEIARQPRGLDEVKRWKATEFRQFLLYTGAVVLKDIVSTPHYTHFLQLSVGISLLLEENEERRKYYLKFAQELIRSFVSSCSRLYGVTFAVYNFHGLLHLHEDVINYNCSLNHISCFPFENYLGMVKKMVKNSHNPVSQVYTHLTTRTITANQKFNKLKVSLHPKDRCFLLENGDLAFLCDENNNKTFDVKLIKKHYLRDLFTNPLPSSDIGIFVVENFESRMVWKNLSLSKLVKKCVCIPKGRSYVIIKLSHL